MVAKVWSPQRGLQTCSATADLLYVLSPNVKNSMGLILLDLIIMSLSLLGNISVCLAALGHDTVFLVLLVK